VRDAVLHVERIVVAVAVIAEALDAMHGLVQRAAEGDVGFLEAAADGEQRHPEAQRLRHDGQRPGVAVRIKRERLVEHVLGIVAGVDVRRRAGEQHAVGGAQQVIELARVRSRHHQRLASGQPDRVDVLLRDEVDELLSEDTVARRHQDERFAGRARGRCRRCHVRRRHSACPAPRTTTMPAGVPVRPIRARA
jgi:hypothetical protein